jgi:membrane fusion protein (multidrug efflux system)
MKKAWSFPYQIILTIGLSAVLFGCQADDSEEVPVSVSPQITSVDTVILQSQRVEVTETLAGRTSAYRIAEVRPQITGIIEKRLFVEGSYVEKGEVLYQIDSATYEAALATQKAALSSAEASLTKAKLTLNRYSDLVKAKAISEQDYEDAQASYLLAQANVEAAQAAVQSAQINLDYTEIKAPISGMIGQSYYTEGALVTSAQSSYLATIQQIDPLYVDISQSSSEVLKMRQNTSRQNGEPVEIKLTLDDGSEIEQKATLQFSDVSVSQSTGTVTLRALLPNTDKTLLPGLYVRAEVPVSVYEEAFLVPQRAVSRDANGDAHLMVVNADNQIEDRLVVTERSIGTDWLVIDGVAENDQIVVNGLQKIRAGSQVVANLVEE